MAVTPAQAKAVFLGVITAQGDIDKNAAALVTAIGDAGAQGAQGAAGSQGTQGVAGAQGTQGAQGAQGGGVAIFLKAELTLTDAQIKALPTTPVEIVTAPGAGKYLLFLHASVSATLVTGGGYTNVTGGSSTGFMFSYETAHDVSILADNSFNSNLLILDAYDPVETVFVLFPPNATPNVADGYLVAMGIHNTNKPIEFRAYNTGNFTGGNAANAMKVTVLYSIIDV